MATKQRGVADGVAGVAGDDPPAPAPDRRPRRRVGLVAAVALGTVVALTAATMVVLSWRWFVRPTVDGPARADAIVMFGGPGDRFEQTVALADAGYADVVVLSDPYSEKHGDSRFEWFCRNDDSHPDHPSRDYEAICFDPEPQTTRGEARFVAELARERGWERVDLVTSVDQATRARMLLRRCWDGDVATVVVPSGQARPLRIAYEWGAMARATLQRRDC